MTLTNSLEPKRPRLNTSGISNSVLYRGSRIMKSSIRIGSVAMFLIAGILLSSIMGATNYWTSAASAQFPVGSGSWNARVPCSSPWIVRITDITDNKTGSASQTSSSFSPGSPNKRWLTSGATPPGWVSPGPPCTMTGSHGTVAVFVEIDGVKREGIVNEDCTGSYDAINGGTSNGGSYCDSTFNIYDPAVVPNYSISCTSSSDPTCYGRIHSEIDHDWKAAHYCGSSTTCDDMALGSQTTTSTLIDVQGFVYWDPDHLTVQWHSFSGWEIHPLTAWRQHQSNQTPDFSISPSPSSFSVPPGASGTSTITLTSLGSFTGTVTLSPSISPNGPTISVNPSSVTLVAGGSETSKLTVSTQSSTPLGDYTVTVAGNSGSISHSTIVHVSVRLSPDFSIAANPSSITISQSSSGTSNLTLTSMNGFSGTVNLSATVSPSGPKTSLSPTSVTLVSGGSTNAVLTVKALKKTSIGNYVVTVSATSGTLSHSITISVSVT